jgi:hypothetical protein
MTKNIERLAAAAVFAVGILLLYLTAPHHGEFWWSDSPRHALNGAFLKDFFATLPHDPKAWAMQYYVKYPALTILFYPPLFYIILAPAYAIFGVSQSTALAAVLLHYFALSYGLYVLSRRWTGPIAAIAIGLSAMAVPGIALWGRQVMLEIPSLAFAVWAMVALQQYTAKPRPALLYLCVFLLLCASYTKLNAAFLFPVLAVTILWQYGTQALRDKHLWLAAILAIAGLIPMTILTLKFGSANVQSVVSIPHARAARDTLSGWIWYLRHFPGLIGWPLLFLAGVATALAIAKRNIAKLSRSDAVLLISWFSIVYLVLSLIDQKEARHALLLLPPLLVAAGLILPALLPARRAGEMLFALFVLGTGFYTWKYAPVPTISGYREAAEWIAQHVPQNAVVVFSGKRDGSYIFNMRTLESRRDISTVRSDKLLLGISIRRDLGVTQKDISEAQIAKMLDDDGISYVVAQDDFWTDLAVMKRFQDVLRSPHFKEVAAIPVIANIPTPDHMLRIYRNLGEVNPHPGMIEMQLQIIGRDVKGKIGK